MKTQKLTFDDGLLRLDINGNGELIFNPSDFNIYHRFNAFLDDLPEMEERYVAQAVEIPTDATDDERIKMAAEELAQAKELDAEVKAKLSAVFGGSTDFDRLLGGVNCMAFGNNGQRIITNLLNAITPYIERGVNAHVKSAVAAAQQNRAQRRARRKR